MSLIRTLLRYFLAGLFMVLPLVITVAIVVWVSGIVNDLLGPNTVLGSLFYNIGLRFVTNTTFAYVLGWAIVLAAIFGLGVLAELGAKRILRDRLDTLANRVPLLGGLYRTSRQLVTMMEKRDDTDLSGMSVVYCTFGGDTGAAFLALLPTPQTFRIGETDYQAVLIPSAPVPVGGSLIFVPATSVRKANISVDAFMSVYVSMGVTGPEFLKNA